MKVGLAQINNSFGGAHYLPYSVGCLQAYAEKNLKNRGDYEFLLPIYKRGNPDAIVEKLIDADIVCFSLYVWNRNISMEVARRLKQKKPDILIAVGGPEVPNHLVSAPMRVEGFLKKYPFVDIACHREGEKVFTSLLENCWGDWTVIPSISYLLGYGSAATAPVAPRMSQKEMYEAPSPYCAGIFDPLMKENPDEQWLVLWETNRGCPFSCTFCDWGDLINAKVFKFDLERLRQELEWIARHKIEFIFCADANFGIFPRDVEIALAAAEVKAQYGYPKALSVQNAKNAEERIFQAQFILHQAGLNKGVTLAFQSRDSDTLEEIKRDNISSEDFRRLQRRFTRVGIETYSDMILALPGETYDSFVDGISETIHDGQHNRIQFGNLSVLPNAEMADPAYLGKYGMKTVTTKAVTYHGDIHAPEWEIDEEEEVVIATHSMSDADWVRTRAFCWMSALLHFDKILQIPLIALHENYGVSYRTLIEIFSEYPLVDSPTILDMREFFREKARAIQRGEPEYCAAPEWLNIWWPADEYIFIKLVREGKLETFYGEALVLLSRYFDERGVTIDEDLLREAILLNESLIKMPFQNSDMTLFLHYNVLEFYHAVRKGLEVPLIKNDARRRYHIDRTSEQWPSWDEWCRKVVWYGNKKGAYLYGTAAVTEEKEGHF